MTDARQRWVYLKSVFSLICQKLFWTNKQKVSKIIIMIKSFKSGRTFWLIIGIITIIMILLLAYVLSVTETAEEPKDGWRAEEPAILNPQAGLGEEGAECGGEMNLPCRPGLACLGAVSQQTTGVCTKVTDKDPGRIEPPENLRSQTTGL